MVNNHNNISKNGQTTTSVFQIHDVFQINEHKKGHDISRDHGLRPAQKCGVV